MDFESMEHLRTWEGESSFIDGEPFRLELYYSHHLDWRAYLGYQFYHGGRLIFEGDDFSPAPQYAYDSDESITALLSFLSLRPGDTDDEYFESYTEEQLEWAERHGEDLSFIVYELEEGSPTD